MAKKKVAKKVAKKRVTKKKAASDKTGQKQDGSGREVSQFKPGQSGNPAGRPKGSRNKLGEAFLRDLDAAWQEHGIEAIQKVARERPQDFLKVVAGILPKEFSGPDGEPLFSSMEVVFVPAKR